MRIIIKAALSLTFPFSVYNRKQSAEGLEFFFNTHTIDGINIYMMRHWAARQLEQAYRVQFIWEYK